MAKSKAKNLKKKKKVSTYDDKLIKIIAASVVGVVAILVAIMGIVSYNNSYVCKVGGKRVMTYEYKNFLGVVMEEMQTEAEDALEEDEEFDAIKFWTDEKIAEAKKQALEDACDWKANYLLAKKAGYGMNIFERNDYYDELDVQLQNTYSYFLQQYGMNQYSFSYNDFISYMTNGMDLSQYRKYALQDRVISDYETALKEKYSVSDTEIKDKYTAEEDTFRKVVLNTYAITLPEIPEVPELPKDLSGEYTKLEDLDEESEKYIDDLKAYVEKVEKDVEDEKFVKDSDKAKAAKNYAKDINELIDALETKKDIKTKMTGIYDQLLKNGKFTGEGFKEDKSTTSSTTTSTAKPLATAKPSASATEKTDATEAPATDAATNAAKDSATESATATTAPSGSATAAPTAKPSEDKKEESDKDKTKYKEYKDATLTDLAKNDGDLFTSTSGKYEFTKEEAEKNKKEKLEIYDFANSLVWADDKHTSIKSDNEKYTVESVLDEKKDFGEGKVKTKVVLLEDDKYIYIVECVGIKDLDTNSEVWLTGETDKDKNPVKETSCIKDDVDAAVREDKLEAELETKRTEAKHKISKTKADNQQKIVDEVVKNFKTESKEA